MRFLFTRISQNIKTGPMPAVMASKDTCPSTCKLRGAGCYAEHGPTNIHWSKLSNDQPHAHAVGFEQLLHLIRALPKRIRWRYGTAGDLPPAASDVLALADANGNREAIVFTHGRDFETYREAGRRGLHINLSADSVADADTLPADMSVVVVLPEGAAKGKQRTPAGREIAICPATYSDGVSCSTCNLCYRPRPRGTIVGFPAHGSRKRAISRRLAGE